MVVASPKVFTRMQRKQMAKGPIQYEKGTVHDPKSGTKQEVLSAKLVERLGYSWTEVKVQFKRFLGDFRDYDLSAEYMDQPDLEEFAGIAGGYVVKEARKAYNALQRMSRNGAYLDSENAEFVGQWLLENAHEVVFIYNYLKSMTRIAREDVFQLYQALRSELEGISALVQNVHQDTWAKMPEAFRWIRTVGRMRFVDYDPRDQALVWFGPVQRLLNKFKGQPVRPTKVDLFKDPTVKEVEKYDLYALYGKEATQTAILAYRKMSPLVPWNDYYLANLGPDSPSPYLSAAFEAEIPMDEATTEAAEMAYKAYLRAPGRKGIRFNPFAHIDSPAAPTAPKDSNAPRTKAEVKKIELKGEDLFT